MRTRPEQVQAYRFVTRRIVGALLSGDPETADQPMRRLAMGLFGGTMIAAIVLAGFGVYGLMVPGGGRPQDGHVIVERETGARYVYLQNTLYPVLNYASARLIVGAGPAVDTLSQASLRGVPRGRTVGIAGAPDALPDRKSLLGLPWSVCTASRTRGATSQTTTVSVGSALHGGAGLGEDTVVVKVADGNHAGEKYVLWNDLRLRVREPTALVVLNLAAADPIPVGEAFLNGVTAGPDLVAPKVANAGAAFRTQIAGKAATVGQVYRSGSQRYVLLAEGLAPLGEVAAALLPGGDRPIDISATDAGRLQVDVRLEPAMFPRTAPQPRRNAGTDTALCATYRGGADPAHGQTMVEVFDRVPPELSTVDTLTAAGTAGGAGAAGGTRRADRVLVVGGRGALVRELPAPGVTAQTTLYLVTDLGVKYPLVEAANNDAAAALGYGGLTPAAVPSGLLALVPTGPTLDPATARLFAGPAEAGSASAQPRPSKVG